jgi:amidase
MTAHALGIEIDPAISGAIRDAAASLEDAGYRVEEVAPPRFEEAAEMFFTLIRTEEKAGTTKAIERFGDDALRRARASTMAYAGRLDFEGYIQAFARRASILREWMLFFERYPLLLTPVSPGKGRFPLTSTSRVTTQSGGCSPHINQCSRFRCWGCPRSPSRPVS